ncbi:MAG: GntR family transcriptional regulator [Rubrivivax sp.]
MDPIDPPSAAPAAVLATLRQGIAEGRYAPGSRMAEVPMAQALGVSRTPVRLAFRTLEQEGLLQRVGKRGLVVRGFTEAEVRCAIDVRGALEGLAARRLAEAGVPPTLLARLQHCLDEGEAVLAPGTLDETLIERWSTLNRGFHGAIVDAGGGRVIADAIARNDHLPFASADSITVDRARPGREHRRLQLAQMQHRLIVDALRQGESARAEALMREHANVGLRYGALFADPA